MCPTEVGKEPLCLLYAGIKAGGWEKVVLKGEDMQNCTLTLFHFWPCHAAYGILVPCLENERMLPALGAWSLNH